MRGIQSVLLVAVGFLCTIMVGCAAKAPANGPSALNIAQFTLQGGAIGVSYRQLLIASGGVQPYTWSITSGSLPAGLSVTANGIISGTPSSDPSQYSTAGCLLSSSPSQFPIVCNFAVQVVDSQGPVRAVATAPESITVNQDLSFTAVSLGQATVGVAYTAMFSASNGVPPYTYSLADSANHPLPDGLSLNTIQPMNGMPNAATITGTATTAGVYTFTVQATDAAGETATAIFSITVVGRLNGPYVVSFNGFDTSQPAGAQAYFLLAQLVAANDMNGSGTVTGILDQNGPGATIASNVAVSGTYNIPNGTNFGTISFTRADNNVAYQFNIALSGTNSDSKLILVDPNNVQTGAGLLKKQATTSLPGGVSYTFGSFGTDATGGRFAGAGAFALSSSLSITGGAEDSNDNGTLSGEMFINGGSFGTPDPNTGRATASFMVGSNTVNYVYYVASGSELVALSTDAGAPMVLVDLLQQQSAGISGGFVLCKQNSMCQGVLELDGIASSGSSSVPEAQIGVASFDGSGNFMRSDSVPPYYVDQSAGGTVSTVTYTGGTYSIDASCGTLQNSCGRVTINLTGVPADKQPVWYLVTTGQAFVVGGDTDVLQGSLQSQTPPSGGFGLPSILGSYLGGSLTPVLPSITNEIDVAQTPPPGGIWAQMYETSGTGGSQTGLTFTGSYNLDTVDIVGMCDPTSGSNCLGAALGRFAICAPMTTQYCTSFTFDPANPPQSIVYIVGGTAVGATGGKTGLVTLNTGVVQSNGTATLDPNPRLSTFGR
ncbi:MAG TPA: putative Ig domain-containing protein [Terriglobales bacterium]|nr:putative Ig domain-containing protein [Terriglobales bacterium]